MIEAYRIVIVHGFTTAAVEPLQRFNTFMMSSIRMNNNAASNYASGQVQYRVNGGGWVDLSYYPTGGYWAGTFGSILQDLVPDGAYLIELRDDDGVRELVSFNFDSANSRRAVNITRNFSALSENGGLELSLGKVTSTGWTPPADPGPFDVSVDGGVSDNPMNIDAVGIYRYSYTQAELPDNIELIISGFARDTGSILLEGGQAALIVDGVVTNVSSNGANDGAIDLSVQGSGSYTFAWDDGPVTEDRTGLAPGSYRVDVTDTVTLEVVGRSFEVTEPGVVEYPDSFLRSSPINPMRFKEVEGEPDGVSVFQTFDNRNFCEYEVENFNMGFHQGEIFSNADDVVCQFLSDFQMNTAVLEDIDGNVLLDIPVDLIEQNIEGSIDLSGFVRNHGGGMLRVYASSGTFGQQIDVGDEVTLSGTVNYDNSYNVQALGNDAVLGDYLVVIGVYVIDENCQLEFPALLPYNVYEITLNWDVLGLIEGRFRLRVLGGDGFPTGSELLSEVLVVEPFPKQTVMLEYQNNDSAFDVVWRSSLVMRKRMRGVQYKALPVTEKQMFRDSKNELSVLNGYVKRRFEVTFFDLAWFDVERLALITSCDLIRVNGVEVQIEDFPQPEYSNARYGMVKSFSLVFEQVHWVDEQNKHDTIDTEPTEVLGADGGAVIGV